MRLSTRLVFFTAIATGVLHAVSAAPYGSEEPRDPNIEGLSVREHTTVEPLSLYDRSNRHDLPQLQPHGGPSIGHDATVLQSRAEPGGNDDAVIHLTTEGAERLAKLEADPEWLPDTIEQTIFWSGDSLIEIERKVPSSKGSGSRGGATQGSSLGKTRPTTNRKPEKAEKKPLSRLILGVGKSAESAAPASPTPK